MDEAEYRCEYLVSKRTSYGNRFQCSGCGWWIELARGQVPGFKYCPHCRRRVVRCG